MKGAEVEAWLDDNPEFVKDYVLRKVNRSLIDLWMSVNAKWNRNKVTLKKDEEEAKTDELKPKPKDLMVRRISAHDFLTSTGTLQPMLRKDTTGQLTFVEAEPVALKSAVRRTSCIPQLSTPVSPSSSNRNEKELLWELVTDIFNDLDVDTVCLKILCNVSELVNADRCSLFLVHGEPGTSEHCLVSQLFDVNTSSTTSLKIDPQKFPKIRIAWGEGIAGHVAKSGEAIVIDDAYQDDRFDKSVDEQTGYTTRSIMCFPIKHSDGKILGVAQAINKRGDGNTFTQLDQKTFTSYLSFCGLVLRNVQMYEQSRVQNRRNQVLLDLVKIVFEEQCDLTKLVKKIMRLTQQLLQCSKCQIYLLDTDSKGYPNELFQYNLIENEVTKLSLAETVMGTMSSEIINHVTSTGTAVTIPDQENNHHIKMASADSILAIPINSANQGQVIGVFQLTNKLDGRPFNKSDKDLVEAFALFCGIGIEHAIINEKATRAQAQQSVAIEMLSYHAVASKESAVELMGREIPSVEYFNLLDLSFDDFKLDDQESIEATLSMFKDLRLIETFQIDYQVLCHWLLSVRKNYRDVAYHNWRHAFNVAQSMFAAFKTGGLLEILTDLEVLCLLVACLCHDLDHRGTNNKFQKNTHSPLATLYSTSVMEHHHFNQCVMLLSAEGTQILSHVEPDEYSRAIKLIEHAILATDLELFFARKSQFFELVDSSEGSVDWTVANNKALLSSMLMTSCDVAAMTKPWHVEKRVAELIASEFYVQGDLEREQLKTNPITMMDRLKRDQIPKLQLGFIDHICLPLYQHMAKVSSRLQPLVDGCVANRKNWEDEANGIDNSKHNSSQVD